MAHSAEDNRRAANVGKIERIISGALGGWLISRAAFKPSLGRILVAGAGGLLVYRGVSGNSWLYRELHISGSARDRRPGASVPYQTGLKVEQSVTISKPASELYAFWKNAENLPKFMKSIESVTSLSGTRSHWVARSLFGKRFEWDAEMNHDEPNARISWQSVAGSQMGSAASVSFKERNHDRGTEVRFTLEFRPVGGPVGAAIAELFGKSPERSVSRDLRRFKQLMETGEIATTAGQSSGKSTLRRIERKVESVVTGSSTEAA